MAVAVPSGIQVFSWIATLAAAKQKIRFTTPALFVLGMLFIFTLGGLTGVMVAIVPFDWQAHDSYFIVAHLHYVLIGGMVFPLFACFYYWAPLFLNRQLSERAGRWCFWLMFIGFNVAFLPQHVAGLLGMPRRVWTYREGLGWEPYNLVSTIGAYILAAGVAVFVVDLIRSLRSKKPASPNPWGAGTLEWLPNDVYSTRSIPHVTSLEPLWDQPNLAQQVDAGQHYLPNAPTGGRETLVTSPRPRLGACMGGGYRLPVYVTGPMGHGWWAMVVLMFVAGSLFLAYMFSYIYLWTVSPEVWPTSLAQLPELRWPGVSALALIACAVLFALAKKSLAQPGTPRHAITPLLIFLGAIALIAAVVCEGWSQWQLGLRPTESSYAAMVYMAVVLNGQLAFAVAIMALFVMARHYAGKLDAVRFASLENTCLLA